MIRTVAWCGWDLNKGWNVGLSSQTISKIAIWGLTVESQLTEQVVRPVKEVGSDFMFQTLAATQVAEWRNGW